MKLKIAAAIAAVSLGACTSVSPFISHISHPDRGWPTDQRSEWSLDIIGVEGEIVINNWELTVAPGYVYTPGEPQPWIVNATVRYRIPINRVEF